MGERILIEKGPDAPSSFHYVIQRIGKDTDAQLADVEGYFIRNGCTYIYHHIPTNPDLPKASYGVVEHLAVVNQRMQKVTR